MKEFRLTSEYIELVKLLKLYKIGETGGQAKLIITEGLVKLNGTVEYRIRAKLRKGDIVEAEGSKIKIV
jgi:ribosome-associated protein